MWLYLCLISTIVSGFMPLVMKKSSLKNDSKTIAISGLFIANLVYVIISICTTPSIISNFEGANLIKILPLSITHAIGYVCAILALKYGTVSTTSPIKKGNAVVTLLLGILVLKDGWNYVTIFVSFLLILLTILIAKGDKKENTKTDIRGIIAAFGFVLANGTAGFLNKVYINVFENPMIMNFYYGLSVVIFILGYCVITGKWKYINIKKIDTKKLFLLHSALDITASLLNRFSLVDGQVSVTSVIQSSSIIITILISRVILKEKISLKKYLMIFGVFICVLLLSFTKF